MSESVILLKLSALEKSILIDITYIVKSNSNICLYKVFVYKFITFYNFVVG
jgi:hypothetical protein